MTTIANQSREDNYLSLESDLNQEASTMAIETNVEERTTLSLENVTLEVKTENKLSTAKGVQQGVTTKPEIWTSEEEKQETIVKLKKGVNACPVKEEVIAPYWANNTRGETLALLNVYPFEQYVHWEKCAFEQQQMFCREGCKCEQQYRLHRLLAFDPKNECRGIFADWFRFPSCCICICYELPESSLYPINRRKSRL